MFRCKPQSKRGLEYLGRELYRHNYFTLQHMQPRGFVARIIVDTASEIFVGLLVLVTIVTTCH